MSQHSVRFSRSGRVFATISEQANTNSKDSVCFRTKLAPFIPRLEDAGLIDISQGAKEFCELNQEK